VGAYDSLAVWRAWPFIRYDHAIREALMQCIMLNGVLIGGSLFLYQILIDDGYFCAFLDVMLVFLFCLSVKTKLRDDDSVQ
jgi:hypothetical protein